MLGFNVAEARHIDAVGTAAHGDLIFVAGYAAAGSAAHGVVHEIASELAARIGQAGGELGSRGIQQDSRGLQGRCVEEDNATVELEGGFGLPVDYAHARYSFFGRIVDQAVDHAVRAKREFASG